MGKRVKSALFFILLRFIIRCLLQNNMMIIMKKYLFMAIALLNAAVSQSANQLAVSDITSGRYTAEYVSGMTPLPGTSDYTRISDDGKRVERYSFRDNSLVAVLFDVTQFESILKDFDDYVISPDGSRLLIETNHRRIYRRSFTADYYIYNVHDKTLVPLSANGAQQVPTFSPDGSQIAFVRENNIFLTDGEGNERQVTTDGCRNQIINGIPDWVNEEEFGFNNAMAWSGDGKSLSWIRYDESQVETYPLQFFQGRKPTREDFADYPGEYSYKYPKAGHPNAIVSVWRYDIATSSTSQYDLPIDADMYVPRIKTIPNNSSIAVYTMNRRQDELGIYLADTQTCLCRRIIQETDSRYVREEVVEGIVITPKHILLPSDRSGSMQLYLYDLSGRLLSEMRLPSGEITEICGFDEKKSIAYCQVVTHSPSEREIVAIGKNGRMRTICGRKGWNSALFSSDCAYLVNTWSDANTPYVFSIYDNKGRCLQTIQDNHQLVEKLSSLSLPKKEFFSFTTSEGISLNGWMIKPADFDPQKQYPVVMFQYSGPGSQQVVNSWRIGSMGSGALFDHYLASKGSIVVCVDGRGTGGRGADFEKSIYLRLGYLEARDQVETAIYLGNQPYVDKNNISIWGWSFGGFCTLMSMSEGRGVFARGVAVAPPTNWKYYDSIYTERYMRTPEENGEGYAINPIERAADLHGELLICHGLADDNVHPQNTFEYSEALVQADKDFRELIYTNRNHSIYGGNTRNHLLRQIADFLIR